IDVRSGDVRSAISIEIPDRDIVPKDSGTEILSRSKQALITPKMEIDVPVVLRAKQIHIPIAVEVGRDDPRRASRAARDVHRKCAVASVEEDVRLRRKVDITVTVEIDCHQRRVIPRDRIIHRSLEGSRPAIPQNRNPTRTASVEYDCNVRMSVAI